MSRKALKNRFGIVSAVCAIMALATAVGAFSVFSLRSSAAEGLSLNYSSGDSVFNRSVSAVEIVKLISGEDCSDAERACLETDGELNFTYTPVLDNRSITISGIGDTITVKAVPVTYNAVNGAAVQWTPSRARLDDGSANPLAADLSEKDGMWVHTFKGYSEALIYTVTVTYEADYEIDADDADAVINFALNTALGAVARQNGYNSALEQYNSAKAAYEQYLDDVAEYNAAYQVYSAYAARHAAYLEKKQAYEDYLEALRKYNEDSQAYEAYLTAAAEYAAALEAYNAEVASLAPEFEAYNAYLAEYDIYLAGVSSCMSSMTALENCFVRTSAGHQLYGTIMGNTVDAVLSKKAELISAGGTALGPYVDAAGDSTDVLRSVLTEYDGIRKTATDREKFEWYRANYSTLNTNFKTLYDSLKYLYNSSVVAVGMAQGTGENDTTDRTLRYCQFVGHLYMITTCLDDTVKTDVKNWNMRSRYIQNAYAALGITRPDWYYYLADLFDTEPEANITDTNRSDPSKFSWPEEPAPVAKPAVSTVVPDEPDAISEPLEPTPVEDPGEPEPEVAEPVKPATVPLPGNQPQAPVFTALERQLMAELESGVLKQRPKPTKETVISETCEVSGILSSDDVGEYPVVTFRDYDGTLLSHIQVREGKLTESEIPSPHIPENDERSTYTFNGWISTDGIIFDFSDIRSDATLYPDVTEKAVVYTVTWSTASGKTKQEYGYGEIPRFSGNTSKKADAQYYYTFAGWDKDPQPVTGDAVYTAQYSKEEIYYDVKWVLGTRTIEQTYKYGESPVCPADPYSEAVQSSDTMYYGFSGWDKTPVRVTSDAVYSAVYDSSWILPAVSGGIESGLAVGTEATLFRARLQSDETELDLTYLAAKAVSAGKGIIIDITDGISVTLPESLLSKLPVSGGIKLGISVKNSGSSFALIGLNLESASGEGQPLDGAKFSFLPGGDSEYRFTVSDGSTQNTFPLFSEGNRKTAVLSGRVRSVRIDALYRISAFRSESGVIDLTESYAAAGEKVGFTVKPAAGFTANGGHGTVTAADGTSTVLEAGVYEFTMPNSDAVISFEFEAAEFTVRFYSDGILFSSATYHYGDRLVEPAAPAREDTDEVGYVFSGWSPALAYTVTESRDYNATFSESPLLKTPEREIIIPEWVYILAAIIVITVTFFVARAIVKRQKRQQNA